MNQAYLKKLKVSELKAELSKHSLDVTGKKEELIARLLENQSNNVIGESADVEPVATSAAAGTTVGNTLDITVGNTDGPTISATLSTTTESPSELKPGTAKTDEERKNERAKRFGIPEKILPNKIQAEKKVAQGIAIKSPTIIAKPVIKDSSSLGILKNQSVVVLLKRQERFGIINPNVEKVIQISQMNELKRKRMERFGLEENGKKSKI